jgi:nucleotide-binding universal stress UspA family protein
MTEDGTEKARRDRVFLVVVDDSPERAVALRYACLRAAKGGGRVTLLRVVEPVEQSEWAGIGSMMQEERREEEEGPVMTPAQARAHMARMAEKLAEMDADDVEDWT